MSTLLDTIAAEIGPDFMTKLGGNLGLDKSQMTSLVSTALPLLVGGLSRNSKENNGAATLTAALDTDHSPSLMEQLGPLASKLLGGSTGGKSTDLVSLLTAAVSSFSSKSGAEAAPTAAVPKALNGGAILGHIFGGDTSGVAGKVSSTTGLSLSKVLSVLAVLAPIVMSALGTMKKKSALGSEGVASMLEAEANKVGAPASSTTGFDLGSAVKWASDSGLLGKLFA